MLESFNTDKFEYKRLSQDEQEKRGILGRLVGKIADTKNPTRNGRLYSNELWENVFNDPIMKEKIDNHLVLGEIGHPTDREEIDITKAAICLAERPKKGKDGYLYGVFDILNTPNGRILKSLCDYGCNVAISSRGTGDVIENFNGDEEVDPNTYSCETFDVVLVPGVEQARLQYVTEALDVKRYNKTLKQKLSEEIDKANSDDKKIMKETLEKLDINLTEDKKLKKYLVLDKHDKELFDSFDTMKEVKEYLKDHRWTEGEDVTITTNAEEIESIEEELVKPTEDEINQIKSDLNEIGFDVDKEGETLFGAHHLQLVLKGEDHDAETLHMVADKLSDLADKYQDFAVTYNVGLTDKHKITCGLDIRDKHVDEELNENVEYVGIDDYTDATIYKKDDKYFTTYRGVSFSSDSLDELRDLIAVKKDNDEYDWSNLDEEFYLHDAKKDEVRRVLAMEVDAAHLRDDALSMLGTDELEKLARKYLTREQRKDLGAEILTPDEMEAKYGVRNLNDLKESVDPRLSTKVMAAINDGLLSTPETDVKGIEDFLQNIINYCISTATDYDIDLSRNIQEDIDSKKDGVDHYNEDKEVVDNQSNSIIDDLQEALKDKSDLEAGMVEVQNKLAVSDAKVENLTEELEKYKALTLRLDAKAKKSKELSEGKIKELEESLNRKTEEKKRIISKAKSLKESIGKANDNSTKLNEELSNANTKIKSLTEELDEVRVNLEILEKENSEKVSKLSDLVESYKKLANGTMRKYIESKANMYGISSDEIINRLPKSYNVDDVDSLCENLRSYNIGTTRLPLTIKPKIRFKESKNDNLRISNPADEIDDELINLANAIK